MPVPSCRTRAIVLHCPTYHIRPILPSQEQPTSHSERSSHPVGPLPTLTLSPRMGHLEQACQLRSARAPPAPAEIVSLSAAPRRDKARIVQEFKWCARLRNGEVSVSPEYVVTHFSGKNGRKYLKMVMEAHGAFKRPIKGKRCSSDGGGGGSGGDGCGGGGGGEGGGSDSLLRPLLQYSHPELCAAFSPASAMHAYGDASGAQAVALSADEAYGLRVAAGRDEAQTKRAMGNTEHEDAMDHVISVIAEAGDSPRVVRHRTHSREQLLHTLLRAAVSYTLLRASPLYDRSPAGRSVGGCILRSTTRSPTSSTTPSLWCSSKATRT